MELKFESAMHTLIGRQLALKQEPYETEIVRLLTSLVTKINGNKLFIDIGSNIGYFSLLFAKLCEDTGGGIYTHMSRCQCCAKRPSS